MNRMIGIMCGCIVAGTAVAETSPLWSAVTNGTFKGTVGTYMEYRDFAAPNQDFAWETGYIELKAESGRYMRTKLGVSVIGHMRLWDADDTTRDNYKVDMEKRFGIPELYLDVGLTDANKTTLRFGRWDVRKLTHIDDSHAEGFYVNALLSKTANRLGLTC